MTPEEAIKTLGIYADLFPSDSQEAINCAVLALKKQISKKPKRVDKNSVFDGNWKMICPCCGAMLMKRIATEYESRPVHYNMTKHCDCVFYSFLSTDYCKNYDCKHHYEDSCMIGVNPTKCGASGVFEYDKYDIGGETE